MADAIRRINPNRIHDPVGNLYSHGVQIPPGARLLFISGQVGADKNLNTPESTEAQLEIAWKNIEAVLADAGMTFRDLVKVTCYLKGPEYATAFAKSVVKFLGGGEEDFKYRPAMTAPIAKQLWQAEWHFEMEAIAAKVD